MESVCGEGGGVVGLFYSGCQTIILFSLTVKIGDSCGKCIQQMSDCFAENIGR